MVRSLQGAKDVGTELTQIALREAEDLGFARAGVTDCAPPGRYEEYLEWLARGDHGTMAYMAEEFHKEARKQPQALLAGARSAIVVLACYEKPSTGGDCSETDALGRVAQYALGDDYHHVFRRKLETLAERLGEASPDPDIEFRACVDSAPLMERELAERAGLGFIAKNTMLITPGLGSYTLIGVLLTTAHLATTLPEASRDCGTCTACLDACPTQAFRAPYKLDARRCISYLTIESDAPIPEPLRTSVGERIFGCDACQDVCPYNAAAPLRAPIADELRPREADRARPKLAMLASLGSNQRKRYVAGSAMRRNRREQTLRNVAVALGNVEPNSPVLDDLANDRNEMVRAHAIWARGKRSKP